MYFCLTHILNSLLAGKNNVKNRAIRINRAGEKKIEQQWMDCWSGHEWRWFHSRVDVSRNDWHFLRSIPSCWFALENISTTDGSLQFCVMTILSPMGLMMPLPYLQSPSPHRECRLAGCNRIWVSLYAWLVFSLYSASFLAPERWRGAEDKALRTTPHASDWCLLAGAGLRRGRAPNSSRCLC